MVKSVLITGAVGGIGQALCEEFSREGYKVIATDLVGSSVTVCDVFVKCDLKEICHSSFALEVFVDSVRDILGDAGLSVLVNNAALQVLGTTEAISVSDWSQTLDVNLTAPFFLVQSFLKDLEVSSGSVINIASIHSHITKPGFVSYATSKAAMVGLTQSLAIDLGGRVRVNAINPGATSTDMLRAGFKGKQEVFDELQKMHPIGRIAEPYEVAQVAVFLASKGASFITGSCINIDGGMSVRLHDPE